MGGSFVNTDELEHVSALIGEIYDVSLDPTLWPSVLQKIAHFVGGPAASIFSKETVHRTGNVFYVTGVEPKFVKSYFDKYVKFDPFTVSRFFFPIEEVVSTEKIMPHADFRQTLFYREWARPQGWVDFVSATLEKSATSYAECGIFRHERNGIADDRARQHMRCLVPHIRRAVLIGNVINHHKVEASALADTLDGLSAGMLLVDAGARIVHANARAQVLLSDGTVLRNYGSRLAATDPRADQLLREALHAAAGGDLTLGTKGVGLPLTAGAEPFVAHILPLTSAARRQAGVRYSAVAAVFVRKATLDLPHPLETIASTYKLTPAEMRVLMAIIEIGGVPEVAPKLGVSETTVKTHLKRVFEKTGAKRQADLVKLVAGFMDPLNS